MVPALVLSLDALNDPPIDLLELSEMTAAALRRSSHRKSILRIAEGAPWRACLRTFARRRAILAKEVTVAMTIDASPVLGQRREVSAGRSAACADVVLSGQSGA